MLTILIALCATCLGWLVWKLETAPEGWEDEKTGFHYGVKNEHI